MKIQRRWFLGISVLGAIAMVTPSTAKAQTETPCPSEPPTLPDFPSGTTCYSGQDSLGAFFLIAIPPDWNGSLFIHDPGGPSANPPAPLTTKSAFATDFILDVANQGWALATTSYRQEGWSGITQAAEDSEHLRQIFVAAFGHPSLTILEGGSYGGIVAPIQMEKFNANGQNYDALISLCGLVAGGRLQGYLFSDQRTVCQYYCQNLPLPSETPYDLFRGVDDPNITTVAVIRDRVNQCTGVNLPPAQRTPAQQLALSNIMNVLTISSEKDFVSRMTMSPHRLWGLTNLILHGDNGLNSLDVVFHGSTDDDALNAGIARYAADPTAVETLIADGEPTGLVSVPVMTIHGTSDERAWPEMESVYRDTFTRAGTSDHLLQLFVAGAGHCEFTIPEFRAAFGQLLKWIADGVRPTPYDVAEDCEGDASQCRFDPAYVPAPWSSRQPPRSPF